MSQRSDAVTVILPVHDGAALLNECLEQLLREVPADSVLVVDDASSDGSAQVAAAHGVRVHSLERTAGPYAARNIGWQQAATSIVVFTDVRCRPRPGWLAALVQALAQPGVAIAGCCVQMVAEEPNAAQRWALKHQPLRGYLDHPFMPYVPTACLAARAEDIRLLGGFSEARSGGDADLCWRAQAAGLGRIVWGDVGMWCRPRSTAADLMAQFRRYAESGWALQLEYGYRGSPPSRPQLRGTAWRALRAVWSGRRDLPVALLDAGRIVTYESRFRSERRRYLARRTRSS